MAKSQSNHEELHKRAPTENNNGPQTPFLLTFCFEARQDANVGHHFVGEREYNHDIISKSLVKDSLTWWDEKIIYIHS